MKTTLSILKADIGSVGGHLCPSQKLIHRVKAFAGEGPYEEDDMGAIMKILKIMDGLDAHTRALLLVTFMAFCLVGLAMLVVLRVAM